MFRQYPGGLHLQPSLLWQTQCAVLSSGAEVLVVDPGYFPAEIAAAQALARQLGRQGAPPHLILTHSDFDHIVGAEDFPGAPIVASARWDAANERRARRALRQFDGEHYIARERPLARPVQPTLPVGEDGQEIAGCRFYLLAGHTRDGLALYHPGSGALIVGDYLSDLEFPFIYVSALAYRASLAKLAGLCRELPVDVLVSQHGRPALGRAEIAQRLRESEGYLEALLDAAAVAKDPQAAARLSAGAWRSGIPPALRGAHLSNARVAWRELRRGG